MFVAPQIAKSTLFLLIQYQPYLLFFSSSKSLFNLSSLNFNSSSVSLSSLIKPFFSYQPSISSSINTKALLSTCKRTSLIVFQLKRSLISTYLASLLLVITNGNKSYSKPKSIFFNFTSLSNQTANSFFLSNKPTK